MPVTGYPYMDIPHNKSFFKKFKQNMKKGCRGDAGNRVLIGVHPLPTA